MSEARTPSESRSPHLEEFLELRRSLVAVPVGGGGSEACSALTGCLDDAVRALASEIEPGPGFAVVAVGGYGRGELALFSDVDLMLLHEEGADPADVAAALFRPMWDAGLNLGHAVRTVADAAAAARDRFDTQTTLLTSRLVAGCEALFERLVAEVTSVTRARPLRRHLVAEERTRRVESPYLLMAADVKAGRGGLRTFHGFGWERRREELIGRFSPEPRPDEAEAYESLLRVRNALHAAAGRRYDIYSPEIREAVSRWLGMAVADVAEMLVGAMAVGDRIASERWPELLENDQSLVRRTWARITRRNGAVVPGEPSPAEALLSMLRMGEAGRVAFDRLWESGHLQTLLGEWDRVRARPQLAPFHEHPVDAHLWRTVDEMLALIEGDDGQYLSIAREVDASDALVLSAFLHDIGKGRGGDHANLGAGIARSVCRRLGWDPELTALVEGAVRHHLLLSETATRRDLDDPAIIDEVAETVGSLRALQVLYLLTVADSRATGPAMWSPWKATLVRTLFVRCAARFGADLPAGSEAGTTRRQVLAEAGTRLETTVKAHLDAMPDDYLRSTSAADVLWHIDLLEEMDGPSNLGTRQDRVAGTAVIVGHWQPNVRQVTAESLAANGIDVVEARLLSRADGMIIDTYRVRDDRTGGPVPSERWAQVRADVESALAGRLDTGSKLASRAEAYSSVSSAARPPRVRVSVDEASGNGVITIRCSDRIGRLAEILSVMGACGLSIHLAKLETREGEIVDAFHVDGASLPADPTDLASQIESSLSP